MRFQGFIGPSNEVQSVNADAQRTLNLFLEENKYGTSKEGERFILAPTPGLTLLATLATSVFRGAHTASNGTLFVVAGNKFYSVDSSWTATERGTLNTDTGPVSMADNGTYVILVDGTDGFTWNIDTSTFATISDVDFEPADTVTFQDGYFILNQSGTGFFFISGLNDVTFDALDFEGVDGRPDNVVAVISVNQNVYVFGDQSIEVYYNSGNADFPFERIQGAVISFGCLAAHSIKNLQGSIFWLGGDDTGSGVVYQMQGYQPMRVSGSSLEAKLRGVTEAQREAATAWVYQQSGHSFYCLNVPGIDSTWCYDTTTQSWHERTYLTAFGDKRHRAEVAALAYGVNVVGDYETGQLFKLDPTEYTDNTQAIARERIAPHMSASLKRLYHRSIQIDMETGVGLDGSGQGTDPLGMLSYSDDGGHTWSNEKFASLGKIGEYNKRVRFNRLGASRDRLYKFRVTEPVKIVILGAELEIEAGLS